MAGWELAQFNIALMKQPLDSPEMADFAASIDRINALADACPGFVWRFQSDEGNATAYRPFGERTLVNLSVWRDVESLSAYVYQSAHAQVMRRRREWFDHMQEAFTVLWWVPQGRRPGLEEAGDRLAMLRKDGAGPSAFSFRQPFPAPAATSG
jgi:hypothetical protein